MYKTNILISKGKVQFNSTMEGNLVSKEELARQLTMIEQTLESLGYKLPESEIQKLSKFSEEELKDFYNQTFETLKTFKRANVNHVVFYEGFPLVETAGFKSYIDAMIHYITGLLPGEYETSEDDDLNRPVFDEISDEELEELYIVNSDEAQKIIIDYVNSLLKSATSWSEEQRNNIKDFFKENSGFEISTIPGNKENLVFLAKETTVSLDSALRTATDILRYVVALSDGDITLAENCKFKKISRPERKRILRLVDRLPKFALEDLYKYRSRWIRLAEFLHPGDYADIYPNAYRLISKLRNKDDKDMLFMSKYEKMYANKDYIGCADLMSRKPGEFARRLDALVRYSDQPEVILAKFEEVAHEVSIPVLLQLRNHFLMRTETKVNRTFVIKGKLTKTATVDTPLEALSEELVDRIVNCIETSIKKAISAKEFFLTEEDKLHILPNMENISLPDNSMRSVGAGRNLTKGSRINIGETGHCLRFFTHWKNINDDSDDSYWNDGRVDIDLAAILINESGGKISEVSWRCHGERRWNDIMAFSGDITNAPKGASEFIDINVQRLQERHNDVRYIVITNNVYTTQSGFDKIPECFSGVMFRKDLNSGEIFEPASVQTSANLTAENCNYAISFVFDTETNEIIWVNSNLNSRNHVAGENVSALFAAVKPLIESRNSLSVADLFRWYAETHNVEIVENIEDATFVLGKDITMFDIEKFAELLA